MVIRSKIPERQSYTVYKTFGLLGSGSQSQVYQALTQSGRLVALKKHPRSREVEALRTLQHPNILRLFDVFTLDDTAYVVTEFADGGSLEEYLKTREPIPLEGVANVITPLANALQQAHNHEFIHRDVKPSNILINRGRAVLGDWGSSARYYWQKVHGNVRRSPGYIAPELQKGVSLPESDQFSLATVAYEMITGRKAFNNGDTNNKPESFKLDTQDGLGKTYALVEKIIFKALSENPRERFSSINMFGQLLYYVIYRGLQAEGQLKQPLASKNYSLILQNAQFLLQNQRYGEAAILLAPISNFNVLKQQDLAQLSVAFNEVDFENERVAIEQSFFPPHRRGTITPLRLIPF